MGSPALLSADFADARRFRESFGLRSDELWIRAVAADPDAREGFERFGVPLLPFERAELLKRVIDPEVGALIELYGSAVPDDFTGVFLDQRIGGVHVAVFSDNLARHRTALEALLPDGAEFEIRSSEWSRAELGRLAKGVERDAAWFQSVGLELEAAVVLIGSVEVNFLGDAQGEEAILDHFGRPPWLTVRYAGRRPWTGPRGNLAVRLSDASGDPMEGLYCQLAPKDRRVNASQAYGISDDRGVCRLDGIPAVEYVVQIEEHDGIVTPRATVEVAVEAGSDTVVNVEVD